MQMLVVECLEKFNSFTVCLDMRGRSDYTIDELLQIVLDQSVDPSLPTPVMCTGYEFVELDTAQDLVDLVGYEGSLYYIPDIEYYPEDKLNEYFI